jgi:aspartate/methionine/tyrosine aminotransferase
LRIADCESRIGKIDPRVQPPGLRNPQFAIRNPQSTAVSRHERGLATMKPNPFLLERYYAKYEFSIGHQLSASDCESHSVHEILALAPGSEKALADLRLGYTESQGHPELRGAIATLYEGVSPEDVVVHSGAEEAILTFFSAALEPGDHVIVHTPAYQSLVELPRAMGCRVTEWKVRPENGWRLDLDELERIASTPTKVVVLNTPHNPSGWLMGRADFDRLLAFTRERGILLFSDEVYRGLEHDESQRLPAAVEAAPDAVSLGVMSKSYGLPGLRIGWLVVRDAALRERVLAMKDYTTICASAPSELIAAIALRNHAQILDRNRRIAIGNLHLLDAFFDEHGSLFDVVRPRAGVLVFPRLKRGDADAFCHRAATEFDVLLLPGSVFGEEWKDHVRIGFGRRSMNFALRQLEAMLRAG